MKRPIDYRAYDSWNAIRTPKLSDDGTSLAYALTPQDGDPTLVVRDLASGAERREARGAAPFFAASGRFVAFTHAAAKRDVDAAKKAKKTDAQLPKAGIGLLDLRAAAPAEIVPSVKTLVVPRNEGATIAYLAEASPTPSPSPSPTAVASRAPAPVAKRTATAVAKPSLAPGVGPSSSPSGPPSPAADASPSPTASPAPKADKTKQNGADLTIRDLVSGAKRVVASATEVVVSDDDRFVAYATETSKGTGDGVHVYDVVRHTTFDVAVGAGRYKKLAIARDGSALAFLSDARTFASDVPRDAAYVVDLHATAPVAIVAVDGGANGLDAASAPSANEPLAFSRDGKRLFLGTAPVPTPIPSGTPEPMKVDLWTYRDDVLQSQQRHDADKERKRTDLGVYDLARARFVRLGASDLRDVVRNENSSVALGRDDRAYRRAASWLGEDRADLYAVSLVDGTRRALARRASESTLAPGGGFALAWDDRTRHWYASRTSDGKRVTLGAASGARFDLEDDDHPEVPQPYGSGGWIAGDRGVLLYDRYDVWLADPTTGAATNLTRGEGRRTHVVYSPVQTDDDALAFDPAKPLLLSLFDERTFASGFASVPVTGGTPQIALRLDEAVDAIPRPVFNGGLHDLARAPLVARRADRVVVSRETFRNDRDLWLTDRAFAKLSKITTANPQRETYRWGTERLIDYRTTDGAPLRGVLLLPDDARPERKLPLLVYFYERFSDTFHEFHTPAPGTSPNFTRYVSNGYAVLLADVRYEIGHPGPSAVRSLLPALDAAIATGYVDPKRAGIAGHSWAAYQINYLITKSGRFKAVEAGAAVDDMISAYGGIRLESGIVRESQYEHTQSRLGATPWDRPDLYLENSGLFGIAGVRTPYLTIHNDLDGAVPQFQGIEYVTAMRRLGKEAYLFSFDGEDHNLRGREQQKYWTVHLDEWFDYWLKGASRPTWMDGIDFLHRGERNVRPLFGEPE